MARVIELFDAGIQFEDQFARILEELEKVNQILVETEKPELAQTEVWL